MTANGKYPRCIYCSARTLLLCARCKKPLCSSHVDVHAVDQATGCQSREMEALQNGQ